MSSKTFINLALGTTNGNVRVARSPFKNANKTVAVGVKTFKYSSNSVSQPTTNTCTALGSNAGAVDSNATLTESYCTFLGADTSVNTTSPSIINSTAIGAYAQVTESNQIVLGGMTSEMSGSSYPVVCIPGNLSFGSLTTPSYQFITVACNWTTSYPITAGNTSGVLLIPYNNSSYSIYPSNNLQFSSDLAGQNDTSGTPILATQIVSVTFSGLTTQGIKPSQLSLMTGPFYSDTTSAGSTSYTDIQQAYSNNGGVYIYATNMASSTNCDSGSFLATIMYNTQSLSDVEY